MPGYTVEQVLSLPWHHERLILDGMVEEDLIEVPEQTDDLSHLEALGITVREG